MSCSWYIHMYMDELFTRNIEEIIPLDELKQALESNRKLRLKLGVDPTSPDIHLGHAVILRKLRAFQDLGHTVIFLIGDATARIGDPSGKNKTRPVLSQTEILHNAQTYLDQVGKIIDLSKAEIRSNSEWLDKLNHDDWMKLLGRFTVAQIIEREDFQKRLKDGSEVGLHELMYPVMQAYDSVALESDVEFGGTDQRFNMLAARALQAKVGQRPQQVLMTKLLVGLDGVQKMSKSLNNYIALTDTPVDMYGKVMSLPDMMIGPYYELCTDVPHDVIAQVVRTMADGANPRDVKASLAREIVSIYHSPAAAASAEAAWNKQFREGGRPDDIPVIKVSRSEHDLISVMLQANLALSRSEARRLLDQRGVKLNDVVLESSELVEVRHGDIMQVGKRRYVKFDVVE